MKRGSQASMFGVINEWKESGLSVREYAQKKGISKSKLTYWIRKLDMDTGGKVDSPFPAFIEVSSVSSQIESPVREKEQAPGKLQIELTFPSGLCLKIFD